MVTGVGSRRTVTTALLGCGAAAGPLFVATFLVEGGTRPEYNPLRHPISTLALGPTGWTQRLNFWVAGGLYVAGALGLWRSRHRPGLTTTAGPILLSTVGLGLVGAGVFSCDPVNGYPPGTPDVSEPTSTGRLHDVFSTPVFLCLPAAAICYARAAARPGDRSWVAASLAAALAQLGTFVVAGAGFSHEQPSLVPWSGAFQRVSVAIGFGWLSALCVRGLRARRPS